MALRLGFPRKRAELNRHCEPWARPWLGQLLRVSHVAEPCPPHPPAPSPPPTVVIAANGQSQMCGQMGWTRSSQATFWMSVFKHGNMQVPSQRGLDRYIQPETNKLKKV